MPMFIRFLTMLAALACFAQGAFASDIMVTQAFARASLTPTTTTASIYLSISNTGATDDELLSVSTPLATSAMIHETTIVDDVMKMRMIAGGLPISAGQNVEMKTGGTHIMLMGLKAPLKKGDRLVLDLAFAKAGTMRIDVPVKGTSD